MKCLDAADAAKNALKCVLDAKKGQHITIFCDKEKLEVSEMFAVGALKLGMKTRLVTLKSQANVYREKVPLEIATILEKHPADIYINLLRGVREETAFRIEFTKMETQTHKARLAHCPGITIDMLTDGAMALTAGGHKKMQEYAQRLIRRLSKVIKVEVTNPAGTHISMNTEKRPFFTDTMLDKKTLKWMNLPTGEVLVAPVEDSLQGKLVCDMAIGGIGPIGKPFEVIVKDGKARETISEDQQVLRTVRDSLGTDGGASVVGEFAFGINPKAKFVEEFLESEKILGTVHVAFGNNSDMPGGKNPSRNHMDMLMSKPTVKITYKDGTTVEILKNGIFKTRQNRG